ncbi:Rec8 like protein-domain-containing protein [Protomyces lactucae-debilis]|uniref:Rec8 like protein-domain-containing protein n=1 Tax=Protomyces lactucae-debilis TaxID=2754530 RepID=A0A1Y2FSU2_PROLT|nr:Rec8 like protein-domain-containing protein [Protomyces lactucae-debilis]ORY87062.1 Rec8 like protein-domain-containing protein [Protomyces lactucae-debilis]
MFYSEVMLQRKGSLAKVWLAAHYEKKLTKNNIIQTSIQSATKEIREENHAPMALRLSGQLLLGVVKIYSRKARYLLEDCNDALIKIKMAFRPGQVDLSSASVRSAQAQAANLILPDTLTEFDLMGPDPGFDLNIDFDFDAPPTNTANVSRAQDITLGERSIEFGRNMSALALEEEEEDILAGGVDLDLDIGAEDGPSLEMGRDAAPERRLSDEFELITALDKGNDTTMAMEDEGAQYQDVEMDYHNEPGLGDFNDFPMEDLPAAPSREPSAVPAAGETVDDAAAATTAAAPVRAKQVRKRRLQDDAATELSSRSMKALQENPAPLTKRARRLPADPGAMHLMQLSMQGQLGQLGWQPMHLHPSIREMLMPGFVREIARARQQTAEAGSRQGSVHPAGEGEQEAFIPDMDNDGPVAAFGNDESGLSAFDHDQPGLGDFNDGGDADFGLPDVTLPEDSTRLSLPGRQESAAPGTVRGTSPAEALSSLDPLHSDAHESTQFESTQQANAAAGVVAIDTATVVAQLKEALGGRTKKAQAAASTGFTTLAEGTSRAAASSLFFQVLLLATKDALKVEQSEAYGEIKIKSKAGLYALSAEAGSQVAA